MFKIASSANEIADQMEKAQQDLYENTSKQNKLSNALDLLNTAKMHLESDNSVYADQIAELIQKIAQDGFEEDKPGIEERERLEFPSSMEEDEETAEKKTLSLSPQAVEVFMRYHMGQGDSLYAVLSRAHAHGDVEASEDELSRLEEVVDEITDNPDAEPEEVEAANEVSAQLPKGEGDVIEVFEVRDKMAKCNCGPNCGCQHGGKCTCADKKKLKNPGKNKDEKEVYRHYGYDCSFIDDAAYDKLQGYVANTPTTPEERIEIVNKLPSKYLGDFLVSETYMHEWSPDVIITIIDKLQGNLPPPHHYRDDSDVHKVIINGLKKYKSDQEIKDYFQDILHYRDITNESEESEADDEVYWEDE